MRLWEVRKFGRTRDVNQEMGVLQHIVTNEIQPDRQRGSQQIHRGLQGSTGAGWCSSTRLTRFKGLWVWCVTQRINETPSRQRAGVGVRPDTRGVAHCLIKLCRTPFLQNPMHKWRAVNVLRGHMIFLPTQTCRHFRNCC